MKLQIDSKSDSFDYPRPPTELLQDTTDNSDSLDTSDSSSSSEDEFEFKTHFDIDPMGE